MKNKVILTDCDGVILDWEYSFKKWMTRHGYVVVKDDCYDIAEAFSQLRTQGKVKHFGVTRKCSISNNA